ncbi:MAG: electron transport complex subunit RsxE [Defluviitaleaceae bacterium]|nr:electron transport complex subunit RsxE [Defluviitaleaceae bacterium]
MSSELAMESLDVVAPAGSKTKERFDYKGHFIKGVIVENPVFKMLLALCPVLGVTATLINGVGMGVIVIFALTVANAMVAIVSKFTPDEVRIPVFITIIATLITAIEMLVQAFLPNLFAALGIFLPLVVTNCILLGRAEAFAAKNKFLPSVVDGLSFGLGFALAVSLLSFIRELIGTGALNFFDLFYLRLFPQQFAIGLFVQPLGAFIALGLIIGVMFSFRLSKEEQEKKAATAQKTAKLAKSVA